MYGMHRVQGVLLRRSPLSATPCANLAPIRATERPSSWFWDTLVYRRGSNIWYRRWSPKSKAVAMRKSHMLRTLACFRVVRL